MNKYTRQRIINTSLKLMSQSGYDATRTKDIATLAGVSEATLFKYFKSKELLLLTLMKDLLHQFRKESKASIAKNLMSFNHKSSISYNELLSKILTNQLQFFQDKRPLLTIITREMLINDQLKILFIDTIYDDFNTMIDVILSKVCPNQLKKSINIIALKDTIFSVLIYYSTIHPSINKKPADFQGTIDLILKNIS